MRPKARPHPVVVHGDREANRSGAARGRRCSAGRNGLLAGVLPVVLTAVVGGVTPYAS